MKSRSILKKCCYRSLRENPKRTAVTIVGIILATALITGVACMAVSFRASMIAYEKQQKGDFHYHFVGVAQEYLKYFRENQYIENYGLKAEVGYSRLDGSRNKDKPYLYISAIEEGMENMLALTLSEGRMPENDRELVVGSHVRSNGLVDIKVGDVLTLQVGDRMSEGYRLTQETPYLGEEEHLEAFREKEYTVVGIIERPNQELEPRIGPGYSAFTFLEKQGELEKVDVYAKYTAKGLQHADAVTAGILGVDEELYYRYYNAGQYTEEEQQRMRNVAFNVQENYWLLKWELLLFSSRTMNMLYGMSAIAILIIIVTSIFCIHNSFQISLTEKMKMYGRLSSIGTTAAQQRKLVYYEASFLGMAGIPLGVAGGIGATAVLVRVVEGLVKDALGFRLIFRVSFPAAIFGMVLAAVTVYLSASKSARQASRISPVSAIRASGTVRMREKELRCPSFLKRLFGIGGLTAYKNLRRARVKYRTTVGSIVVSVAVFIGMSTFVELLMFSTAYYYKDMPYQLNASIYQWDFYDQALLIASLDGVEEAEVVRSAHFTADLSEIDYAESFQEGDGEGPGILVVSLGEEAYARYCRNVGVTVEEARDKCIVMADYSWKIEREGKIYTEEGEIVRLKPGEILMGKDTDQGIAIEILTQTHVRPMYMTNNLSNQIILIVSDEWMDNRSLSGRRDNIEVYVRCENADRIEESIRSELLLQHFTVNNYEARYRSERSMHLVTAIFLYGFITVVALIGITNIFNTVTTNMELRAPEFAMLKAVGMTGREFRRMIWLEGMFYGGRALLIGIPAGVALSAWFNRALGEAFVTGFRFPWLGVGISIAAVAVLLFVIMNYSLGKINRRNIIETIQNENI